jgi:hypothetical protein
MVHNLNTFQLIVVMLSFTIFFRYSECQNSDLHRSECLLDSILVS